MVIPPAIFMISIAIEKLLLNIDLLIIIIPKLLQLIGMSGWLWQGWHIYRDTRWQSRSRGFLRATITWAFGVLLEIFVENFEIWF